MSARIVRDGRDLRHAELEHHGAGDLGHALEVVGSTIRDAAEDDLLGGATREVHHHEVEELLARVHVAILGGVLSVYPSA